MRYDVFCLNCRKCGICVLKIAPFRQKRAKIDYAQKYKKCAIEKYVKKG